VYRTDLSRGTNVRASAGTHIGRIDLHDADRIDVGGERNEPRPPGGRLEVPLGSGHHADKDRPVTIDGLANVVGDARQCVGGDRSLEFDRRGGPGKIGLARSQSGPGEDPCAREVLARMEAHVTIPTLPVDGSFELDARLNLSQRRGIRADPMDDD
jgi:hypothetical protein